MSDDLITSLRALAAARHDDLSIAVDAVIEIERLRAENARLRARIVEYFRRAVEGCDREMRLYAVWCARQVQHLMCDRRSVAALDVAERYARGQASSEELAAAWKAARAAAAAAAAAESAARAAEAARGAAALASAWAACEAGTAKAAQADELRRICEEIEAGRDPYPMEEAKP